MAREYARFRIDAWTDEDFRSLPGTPQHLYLYLLSSPTLNYCGVSDWRPNRIAANVGDWTSEDVRQAAKVLSERLFVVIDEETEEILVRSFLRHDGVMKEARLAVSMVKAYAAVASPVLRGVIIHELQRLHYDHGDWGGWKTAGKSAGMPGQALDLLVKDAIDPASLLDVSPSLGAGLADASPSLGRRLGQNFEGPGSRLADVSGSTSPSPTPTPSPQREALPLPAGWWPAEESWTWAERSRAELDLEQVTRMFVNDRIARGLRRADWDADWRNWVLRERVPTSAVVDLREVPPAATAPPSPWCEQCDEHDRTYEDDDGRVHRCPACHPAMTREPRF